MNWTLIFGAVTAVAALFGSFAVFLVMMQIQFASWIRAQEVFNDCKFRKARGKVLKRYWQSEKERAELKESDAYLVCAKMDEFARVVPYMKPFIRKKKVFNNWDDPIGKCWHVLEKFIDEEREKTGWEMKWKAFEILGKKAYAKVEQREREKERRKRIIQEMTDA